MKSDLSNFDKRKIEKRRKNLSLRGGTTWQSHEFKTSRDCRASLAMTTFLYFSFSLIKKPPSKMNDGRFKDPYHINDNYLLQQVSLVFQIETQL